VLLASGLGLGHASNIQRRGGQIQSARCLNWALDGSVEAARIVTSLVVGATGWLGTAIVRELQAQDKPVRALVRPTSDYGRFTSTDVELAFGDLRDADSLERACEGVDAVLSTASAGFPRGRYDFSHEEDRGYDNLIRAARNHGVNRFVYVSATAKDKEASSLTYQMKRLVEEKLRASGLGYTIFRPAIFMDDYFSLMGSTILLRGAEGASLLRPFWFSRAFMRVVGSLIDHGIAVVSGSPERRHSFIAIRDVAQFMVNSLDHPEAVNRIFDVGGPEILSWREVANIYGRIVGRRVRIVRVPAALSHPLYRLASPFSPATANMLSFYWLLTTSDTLLDTGELAEQFGVRLTRAEDLLREKAQLPPIGAA
jgi:uncharacterized protein YbjT (DUF2867 family)